MGIYGTNQGQNLYPGQTKKMLGITALPGTPVVAANETLPADTASSYVVVASQPGAHPSTQRQIIWRIFASAESGSPPAPGIAGLELQASVDNVAANYVTRDTSVGGVAVEVRTIPADFGATAGPGEQSALKIVSSARFFRVYNPTDASATATVDLTCQ
jgi:hypothetical protein